MVTKLQRMFLILLFLCSLLLLLSVSVAVASPYPNYNLTKDGRCRDKCGNVTIPFPFGIGADCFLDEWYEILCNNSIPRLKKLDLQVLNISFPRDMLSDDPTTVTVNYPVSYSNSSCVPSHHGSREPVTFHGSPFFVSRTYNIFVAVGCENFAIVKGSNHSFVGCSTECIGNNTRRYSPCDGLDCCQSTIPDDLQGFGVDFPGDKIPGTSGGDRGCQFAFLVNSSWFEPNSTDLYAIRDGEYIPVVLRWGIVDAAFPTSIGLINRANHDSYSNTAYCSGSISLNATTPFINCNCSHGLYGNPYLKDGCQDVNECEIPRYDGSMPCGGLRNCKNKPGYFTCKTNYIWPLLARIGMIPTKYCNCAQKAIDIEAKD